MSTNRLHLRTMLKWLTPHLNEEIKKKLTDIKKHSIHNGYTGDTTFKFNRVNKTYKDYL